MGEIKVNFMAPTNGVGDVFRGPKSRFANYGHIKHQMSTYGAAAAVAAAREAEGGPDSGNEQKLLLFLLRRGNEENSTQSVDVLGPKLPHICITWEFRVPPRDTQQRPPCVARGAANRLSATLRTFIIPHSRATCMGSVGWLVGGWLTMVKWIISLGR